MPRWSERQLAMLREIGVQHFWPVAPQDPAKPEPVPAAARVAAALPPPLAAPVALSPRPLGIDTLGWPALRDFVAGCRACALCEKRRQTVFGAGHPQAHWMLVGEGPGEQEDLAGEPFVGRSGQLLDRMLLATGLTRADAAPEHQVYIANAVKCRPPDNRNPLPAEVAQCAPFLQRQIELVRPKVILAMGKFAAQSVLKSDEAIGRLRGRVHQHQGVPVVVTYHPAYLLRNPADKALAWDDLCLAREAVQKQQAAND